MHALERRRRILELLQAESFVTVEQVQSLLGASPATIRRDFAELSTQGLVVRGHGGVHRIDNAPVMGVLPLSRRKVEHPEGKQRIAAAAADLLRPEDVVIIDGGSTTAGLAHHLSPKVRVITNSITLVKAMTDAPTQRNPAPEINMTGGYIYPNSEVLLGPQTVLTLREYNANWAFLGASGVTHEGILNSNNLVVDTQREMIARSQKVVFLIDGSKWMRTAMVKVCPLDRVDIIISDEPPPPALRAALAEHEVELIVAGRERA